MRTAVGLSSASGIVTRMGGDSPLIFLGGGSGRLRLELGPARETP
jgi:hypothetical protein